MGRVRESWAIALHDVLVGMPDVLVGQLVPDGETYELVLTTRTSPPDRDLVGELWRALGPLLAREDSALAEDEFGGYGWHFYPPLGATEKELLQRLDWSHAVVVHEFVD